MILSKGHCVPALYFCMAKAGFFPDGSQLITLRKLGSPLQGHPDRVALPGIEAATGSLGQGLSVAMGMALGLKLSGKQRARLLHPRRRRDPGRPGLGERRCRARSSVQPNHPLDNLCVILDYNKIQLDGFVTKILDLEPVVEKWKAFGWPVQRDRRPRLRADRQGPRPGGSRRRARPSFIVAHTVKGKGVSFMENNPEWHGKAPKPAEAIARHPRDPRGRRRT